MSSTELVDEEKLEMTGWFYYVSCIESKEMFFHSFYPLTRRGVEIGGIYQVGLYLPVKLVTFQWIK